MISDQKKSSSITLDIVEQREAEQNELEVENHENQRRVGFAAYCSPSPKDWIRLLE